MRRRLTTGNKEIGSSCSDFIGFLPLMHAAACCLASMPCYVGQYVSGGVEKPLDCCLVVIKKTKSEKWQAHDGETERRTQPAVQGASSDQIMQEMKQQIS